ncbi:TlpA family protein disulfide reductase [Mesorhizobium kowhaii]|uniref:TlpA family protein disulfide reductase n=1 Tax=Mesorhizobium kowhaii TaxID=1300272 RepID=UPI00315D2B0A
MNKRWMEPSFYVTIPTSFVVGRDGHIGFIGEPTKLDGVLPRVLDGSWRTCDQAKAADREWVAEGEAIPRETALTKPIYNKLRPAMQAEDWKTALSAVEEGIAVSPDNLIFRQLQVKLLLHRMHDMQAGLPVMRQFVRDAINRNFENWMIAALDQLFSPNYDHSDFPSAERLAIGKQLSEHIMALNLPQGEGRRFWSYPAIARYYHESGNKDRAIELIELALKSLDGPEAIADGLKQYPDLLHALANFKGENICYGALCAAPRKEGPSGGQGGN